MVITSLPASTQTVFEQPVRTQAAEVGGLLPGGGGGGVDGLPGCCWPGLDGDVGEFGSVGIGLVGPGEVPGLDGAGLTVQEASDITATSAADRNDTMNRGDLIMRRTIERSGAGSKAAIGATADRTPWCAATAIVLAAPMAPIAMPIEVIIEQRVRARQSRRSSAVARAARDLGGAARKAMRIAQREERGRIGYAHLRGARAW